MGWTLLNKLIGATFILGACLLHAPASQAQTKLLDEVKIGLLAHDVGIAGGKEKGADVSAELLFASPEIFKYILRPRPMAGLQLNSSGYTSQAYVGLAWQWALATDLAKPGDAVFFGFSFGASFNDGKHYSRENDRKSLGSNLLFRESFELGYQLSKQYSVSAYLDHVSNGGIHKYNQSLNNLGVRVGYKF
jgi:lipid A 3-O-deacylase